MNSNKALIIEYTDKYGTKKTVRPNKRGILTHQREKSTVFHQLAPIIGTLIGQKIRAERLKQGLTLEHLCQRSGLVSATPKSRMWEIENNTRKEGIRFGTLYAIAIALGVEPKKLIPTVKEIKKIKQISFEQVEKLAV